MLTSEKERLLRLLILDKAAPPPPATVPPRESAPASYSQRRLWFLDQVQRGESPYTIHSTQHLRVSLDTVVVDQAIQEIARRHEILRTTFHREGEELMQRIAPEGGIPLEVEDLRSLESGARPVEVSRRMTLAKARRFDLEKGPLLRTHLYRLGDKEWLFLLTVHHIIFDGPSIGLFFSELQALCEAGPEGMKRRLPPLRKQYQDFSRAHRVALTPARLTEEVAFWRTELARLPVLDLPLDRPRTSSPTFRGSAYLFEISSFVTSGLRQRASAQHTTLFTVLLTALSATLARLCRQDDFAIGLPVSGRDAPEWQNAIGFFVDTLVIRTRLHDNPTVERMIQSVSESLIRSLAHRLLPFEMLVEHLRPVRDVGMNPLFQVGFQLIQNDNGSVQNQETPRAGAMFDLGLDMWTNQDALSARLEYNTDLFDPSTIAMIGGAYQGALESFLHSGRTLSDVQLAPSGSSPAKYSVLDGPPLPLEAETVVDLLESVAAENPDAISLEGGAIELTYRELTQVVQRLARALGARGVGSGTVVALLLPRSAELVCFALACLRAGAAFVPLDPTWPTERLRAVLENCQPSLVIDDKLAEGVWREPSNNKDPPRPRRDHVAYIIFTSGSTGVPKGVVLEHGGLINIALSQLKVFRLAPGRRIAQLASPVFDASIFEMMLGLSAGATVVVSPPEMLAGDELAAFIRQKRIDTVVLPPSLLATARPADCPSLKLICVAGEKCSADLAAQWHQGREFWNLYGPTETTIWATFGEQTAGSQVVIGRPIPNLRTLVADAAGRPVPIGVPGELYIGGVGVARGYLNLPDLTRDRFITDAEGQRFYRTGDLVRQREDAQLLFLGRVDRQVKRRGFRIQPEEVETILRRHRGVAEVVVANTGTGGEDSQLNAYIRSDLNEDDLTKECRALLLKSLPTYMMPDHFVVLRELPRSASGKVDYTALPEVSRANPDNKCLEPRTETESVVAELMAKAARAPKISASENFFQVGGHSLAAAQLVSSAREIYKVSLTIRDVFAHPTVAELAERIDELARSGENVDEEWNAPLVPLPREETFDGTAEKSITT